MAHITALFSNPEKNQADEKRAVEAGPSAAAKKTAKAHRKGKALRRRRRRT